MSTDKCDEDVYRNGTLIAVLDACKYRAEAFSVAVAEQSGQRVDWHYVGGRACVAALGDVERAKGAADDLAYMLRSEMFRKEGECGSCGGIWHREGNRLD